MRQRHVKHLIVPYLYGQLGHRSQRYVREHVTICEACRAELYRHQMLVADLRLTIGQLRVPADVHARPSRYQQSRAKGRVNRKASATSLSIAPLLLSLMFLVLPLVRLAALPQLSTALPERATLSEVGSAQLPEGVLYPLAETTPYAGIRSEYVEATQAPPSGLPAAPLAAPTPNASDEG